MQQHVVERAAVTAGHALHIGVQRKLASHLTACRDVGVDFVLVVFESTGGAAEDIIRAIERAVGQRSSSPDYSVATKQLFDQPGSHNSVERQCMPVATYLHVIHG